MQIQVNTDSNIKGREALAAHITEEVSHVLGRFADYITRVEVHLSDENAEKSGSAGKRCVMEARPSGHQPVAVTHHGATLQEAYVGAAHKLQSLLASTIGRLEDRKKFDLADESDVGPL